MTGSRPMALPNHPAKKGLKAPEGAYERFLYSVSHDLQEPLRMISSFLKLLETKTQGQLDPDAQQYLDYGIENAERMKRMIYALVELSRVARNTETPQVVSLNEVVDDLKGMFSGETDKAGSDIVRGNLPPVLMPPSQVVNLFKILFQNSFDNPGEEPMQITVEAHQVEDRALIEVRDNGRGINPVYLDKIFEMFKRTDARSEKIGAGLTIAREIVQKHGGEINLESTPGEGTTAYLSLPLGVL